MEHSGLSAQVNGRLVWLSERSVYFITRKLLNKQSATGRSVKWRSLQQHLLPFVCVRRIIHAVVSLVSWKEVAYFATNQLAPNDCLCSE